MTWCQHCTSCHDHRQLKRYTSWFLACLVFLNIIFWQTQTPKQANLNVFLHNYAYKFTFTLLGIWQIVSHFLLIAVTHMLAIYLPVGLFRVEDMYALTRPTQI